MRCVTYHRTSTSEQDPTTARDDLRRAAAQRGYTIVAEEEETGSGVLNDRPGLERVLSMARRGQIDVVLAWKLDRFGRSSLDLQANVMELNNCGVTFVAMTQGLECRPGGDAMSKLFLQLLGAIAEYELDLIRERTRAGMARARKHGTRSGRPIGRPLKGNNTKPDATRVKAMRAQGASWSSIANELRCSIGSARKAAA